MIIQWFLIYFFQDVSLTEGGSEPIFDLSDISPTSAAASPPKGTHTVFNSSSIDASLTDSTPFQHWLVHNKNPENSALFSPLSLFWCFNII